MAKRAAVAKKVLDDVVGKVAFQFADGVSREFRVGDLPQEIIHRLALHGLSQKLGDSYASRDDKGWTVGECRDEAMRVWANLTNGVWADRGGAGTGGILAEALARATGRELAECVAVVTGLDEDGRKALGKNPQVKAAQAAIQAERAAAKAEALEGVEGDGPDLADLF